MLESLIVAERGEFLQEQADMNKGTAIVLGINTTPPAENSKSRQMIELMRLIRAREIHQQRKQSKLAKDDQQRIH